MLSHAFGGVLLHVTAVYLAGTNIFYVLSPVTFCRSDLWVATFSFAIFSTQGANTAERKDLQMPRM